MAWRGYVNVGPNRTTERTIEFRIGAATKLVKAVLGERRVPFCLQHLQNRLLDEVVERVPPDAFGISTRLTGCGL